MARTLRVDGHIRRYRLYAPPPGSRAGAPLALVMVLHGAGGTAARVARHTGFTQLAEREGFAVAYPEGLEHRWNDGRGFRARHDDVGFIRVLLDTLRRELDPDPRRIYATGISNGAMFAHRLACDLPGVFAAIAPVAGALPAPLEAGCGAAPVSVAAFQGTSDRLVSYSGGGVGLAGRRGAILSARGTAEFWARVDGCGSEPDEAAEPNRSPEDGTRVTRTTWNRCADGREVTLYTIEGGGHTWPGGPAVGAGVGRVTRDLSATETIWRFFRQHPGP